MAKYTIELGTLVKAGFEVFDDTWSTFIPEHKRELCNKILRHYWFYEIGSETPDRFKHYLNEQLALVMPYYNQLYQSELLELTPLYNYMMVTDDEEDIKRKRLKSIAGRKDRSALIEMAESMKRLEDIATKATGTLDDSSHEVWSEDTDGSTKKTIDEDTTSSMDGTTSGTKNQTNHSTEAMTDGLTGTKDTTSTADGTGGMTRKYSDTPQAQISTTGMTIEQSYLTNYTNESTTSHSTTTTKETLKNDEKKDTTTDVTIEETTSGTSKENGTGTKDVTETGTSHEEKVGNKDGTLKRGTSDNQTSNTEENEFKDGSQTAKEHDVTATAEDEDSGENRKNKVKTMGLTASQSELLEAYRRTFLNIDKMIVDVLQENFMGVF